MFGADSSGVREDRSSTGARCRAFFVPKTTRPWPLGLGRLCVETTGEDARNQSGPVLFPESKQFKNAQDHEAWIVKKVALP